MWKVYRIESDEMIRGGFSSEEDAKDWLERQRFAQSDEVTIDEMDSDEEELWLEQRGDAEDESPTPTVPLRRSPAVEEEEEEDDDDVDVNGIQFHGGRDADDDDYFDDDDDDDDEDDDDYFDDDDDDYDDDDHGDKDA